MTGGVVKRTAGTFRLNVTPSCGYAGWAATSSSAATAAERWAPPFGKRKGGQPIAMVMEPGPLSVALFIWRSPVDHQPITSSPPRLAHLSYVLEPDEYATRCYRVRARMRNWAGVVPVWRLKVRVRWLWSAKPAARARSAREISEWASSPHTNSTRKRRRYSPIVQWWCRRNTDAR